MDARFSSASLSLSFVGTALAVLLTGCSASFTPSSVETESQTPIGVIQGRAFGGQAPISGADIYLFAAGTSGYGSAATSLINNPTDPNVQGPDANGRYYVTTDTGGSFSVGGDYTCTPGTQVYMLAMGGNSGSGTNNPYIAQMAGLGECPAAGNLAAQVPFLMINEQSTVVFAYAMAGFYGTDEYHIGSNADNSASSKIAIHNAMANVSNILNVGSGQVYATTNASGSGTVPTAKIISLANLLATCVNTDGALKIKVGGKYTPEACYTLFNNTVGTTGYNANTVPANGGDEAQAVFYLAKNPTSNVSALFGAITGTPAFSSGLTSPPADWTLPIVYSGVNSVFNAANGTTIAGPFNLAFDANGNAWIGDRVLGVVEINPLGVVSTYNHGFGMIKGVSVDPSGNIWAVDYAGNHGSGSVYIMDTSGDVGTTITTGLNGPSSIAFDRAGRAFVANETGDSASVYSSAGALVSNSCNAAAFGNNLATPGFITVDPSGNAWLPSTNSQYMGKLTVGNGATTCATSTTGVSSTSSYAVLIDSSGNPWVSDYTNSSLDQEVVKPNGTSYTAHEQTGGGISEPYHIAIDGSGTLWVSSYNAALVNSWTQKNGGTNGSWGGTGGFSTCSTYATSPSACKNAAYNVTVVPDPSGNVWVTNVDGSVTELLGLATPTAAPLTPADVGTEP